MFDRYSEEARRTIFFARYEAAQLGSPQIAPEHILLGLLRDESTIPSGLEIAVSIKDIRDKVLAYLPHRNQQSPTSDIPLSGASQELLAAAVEEADRLPKSKVTNHHILLALSGMEKGVAAQVLRKSGLSTQDLRKQMELLREKATEKSLDGTLANAAVNLSPAERKLSEVEARLLELFRVDDYKGALTLVNDAIADPGLERNQTVRMLVPIATNIARIMGDFDLVKHYCEILLACDPDNPMGLYISADCLSLQGKTNDARQIAHKAHQLSLAQESVQGRSLAELIEHRFPEIKSEK